MKQITFQQLFSIFDETKQIPQRLIIYSEKNISALKEFVITGSRTILLVTNGNIQISLNHKKYTISANTFFDLTENKSFRFINSSKDVSFYCVFSNLEFFREALKNIRPVPHAYLRKIQTQPETTLTLEEARVLESAIKHIQSYLNNKNHLFRREIINNLFVNFMYEIGNIVTQNNHTEYIDKTLKKQDVITTKFVSLVRKCCKEKQDIAFYAKHLNITPKHLGRTVKSVTQKTPYSIICEELLIEAIDLIQIEDLSVQQIAEQLHFADIASFSKFFKKHTGKSPVQYRDYKE